MLYRSHPSKAHARGGGDSAPLTTLRLLKSITAVRTILFYCLKKLLFLLLFPFLGMSVLAIVILILTVIST